jgi:hypothetical protein
VSQLEKRSSSFTVASIDEVGVKQRAGNAKSLIGRIMRRAGARTEKELYERVKLYQNQEQFA